MPVPDDTDTLSRCFLGNSIGENVCLVVGNREWGRATGSAMTVVDRSIERGGVVDWATSTSTSASISTSTSTSTRLVESDPSWV